MADSQASKVAKSYNAAHRRLIDAHRHEFGRYLRDELRDRGVLPERVEHVLSRYTTTTTEDG